MPDFSDLGPALLGFSAGLQGRGQQFLANRQRQQELELQKQQLQQQEMKKLELERMKTVFTDSKTALDLLNRGDIQGIVDLGNARSQILQNMGVDSSDTQRLTSLAAQAQAGDTTSLEKLQTELSKNVGIGQNLGIIQAPSRKEELEIRKLTAEVEKAEKKLREGIAGTAETQTFESLVEQADLNPEETKRAARIKLGLEKRQGLTPEEAMAKALAESVGKEKGKGDTKRLQGFVDSGVVAADSTAVLRRGLKLLNEVKTGGIDAAALKAKQFFGVEGADEAELSANLGKAVLSQLRETFGAAFTEKEGDRLARIEAGFGKSTAGNKRLLQQTLKIAERAARRGISAANKLDNEFARKEIEAALKFTLTDDAIVQALQDGSDTTQPQRNIVVDF